MTTQVEPNLLKDLATFSSSGLDAAIKKIQDKIKEFRDRIAEFLTAVRDAIGEFVDAALAAINSAIDELLKDAHLIMATFTDLVKLRRSPADMFHDALQWEGIAKVALQAGNAVDPVVLNPEAKWTGHVYTSMWTGLAADAYNSTVPAQHAAVLRIYTIADKTASALGVCASVGMTLYTALAQLIANVAAMVPEFIARVRGNKLQALDATQALWARVRDLLGNVIALLFQVTQAMSTQSVQVAMLTSIVTTDNDFPNGTWPNPTGDRQWPKIIDGKVEVAL